MVGCRQFFLPASQAVRSLLPSTPMFYDTHAHLDYPDFTPDFDAMLERARAAGVTKIISIGTNLDSSRRAIALAGRHPEIYAVAGGLAAAACHPVSDLRSSEAYKRHLADELTRRTLRTAVGRIGER